METDQANAETRERVRRLVGMSREVIASFWQQVYWTCRNDSGGAKSPFDLLSGGVAAEDLKNGSFNSGLLDARRDPAIREPADAVVFLQRRLVRAVREQERVLSEPPRSPIGIHRLYIEGLHEPFEFDPGRNLPSLLAVVADDPDQLRNSFAGEMFLRRPCSFVLTLVEGCRFKAAPDLGRRLPDYRLSDVVGSVIADVSTSVRRQDLESGEYDFSSWRQKDETGRITHDGKRRTSRQTIPQFNLVTGRAGMLPRWVNVLTKHMELNPEGRFFARDRVSAVEAIRSMSAGETFGWLFQPGALTSWTWGAIVTQALIGDAHVIGEAGAKDPSEGSSWGPILSDPSYDPRQGYVLLRATKPR